MLEGKEPETPKPNKIEKPDKHDVKKIIKDVEMPPSVAKAYESFMAATSAVDDMDPGTPVKSKKRRYIDDLTVTG